MKVFYGFDALPQFRRPVVTMGSYDGVHCGHRQLLSRIVRIASSIEGESVVVTFSPHPRLVLELGGGRSGHGSGGGGEGQGGVNDRSGVGGGDAQKGGAPLRELNSVAEKAMLLEEVGIDNLIVAPFTEEFSRISSYDFVKRYLIGKIGVRVLVVGYNHHFGHDREGDYGFLSRLQGEFDFEVYELPRQEVDRQKVSSTMVRELIGAGKMAQAARNLGRPYFALLHRDEGTLRPDIPDKLLPPPGKYPVAVEAWSSGAGTAGAGMEAAGMTVGGTRAAGVMGAGAVGVSPNASCDRGAAVPKGKPTHTLTIAPGGGLHLAPAVPAADFIVTFL